MDARALAELAADPERLDSLPDEELPEVLAVLRELEARVWMRLSRPPEPTGNGAEPPTEDRMLKVEDAAEILGVTEDWLYDHADDLPFARKLGPRTRRFSRAGMYRWLETRP